MQKQDVKRFECPDGFAVESPREDEIVVMAKMHMRDVDKQDATDEYVKSNMKNMSHM